MTPRRQPRPVPQNLREILAAQVQALQSPYRYYRVAAHRFLAYLQSDFPDLRRISELRRDPHLLGWIRGLCQQDPPLSNYTRRIYITGIRRGELLAIRWPQIDFEARSITLDRGETKNQDARSVPIIAGDMQELLRAARAAAPESASNKARKPTKRSGSLSTTEMRMGVFFANAGFINLPVRAELHVA